MAQKILIVDDEGALRELLSLALTREGFETLKAESAVAAIKHLSAATIDLVILDLRLGNGSGLEVLTVMRAKPQWSSLPVIMLTGTADSKAVAAAMKLGVQGYVLKSQFSIKDLIKRITPYLKAKRQKQPDKAATAVKAPPLLKDLGVAAPSGAPVIASGKARIIDSPQTPLPPVDAGRIAADASDADDDDAAALRSLKPLVTRPQMLEYIERGGELKALSPNVAELIAMTEGGECSLDQIARVVKRDQAIAIKVLKIANSAIYNRGESVDTVQKALTRIGTSQIRQMALNISVIDRFRLAAAGDRFSSELFWEHSIGTGLIAAAIIRLRNGNERLVDTAFTMGLLHDVGRMVLAEQLGGIYKQVLDLAAETKLPLEEVESQTLSMNHAQAMNSLLQAWKFPKPLVDPITLHHVSLQNSSQAPQQMPMASLLVLANRLAHAMLLGSSGNETIYPTEWLVRLFKLQPEQIKTMEEQIPDQTNDMKYAMLQTEGGGQWPDHRASVLKHFKSPLRPLYVSADSTCDAHRILFDRLREPASKAGPNFAVLYIAESRERNAMGEQLLKSQQDAGAGPLPLLIISPSGLLKLDNAILSRKPFKLLATPFTLAKLANVVNELFLADDNTASFPANAA